MEKQKIIESLSLIERKVLPNLKTQAESLEKISKESDLDTTTSLRALEFLKNKELVEIKKNEFRIIDKGINGINYSKKGLPERKLLTYLIENKSIPLNELDKIGLNKDEAKASIGVLKRKATIDIKNQRALLIAKKEEVIKKTLEEKFLEKLPIKEKDLQPEDKFALKNLQARKEIILIEDKKEISANLTELGEEISKQDLDENLIEQLTPQIIQKNYWKGKKFRRYDLNSPAPKIYGGKKHFVNQATEYAKKIWLEMGFQEMKSKYTISSFWNFDALFTAQDHPVREMQDTFFIKDLEADIPLEKNDSYLEEIKKVHEGNIKIANGETKGWQESWKEENAKRVLLRTHTTPLSVKTLKTIAEEVKKGKQFKYFALGKCFRNETVDWSHGFEFNQTEGIVVDENANFRQLLGYLVEFFKKMGYEKIRIRPAYFPYTEPSLEIDVFHPIHKEWLELGGAGMFRPEVTVPIFGKHIPVLAWGPGFDRIIMEYFNINDLREMYKNNITKLREMKYWMK